MMLALVRDVRRNRYRTAPWRRQYSPRERTAIHIPNLSELLDLLLDRN